MNPLTITTRAALRDLIDSMESEIAAELSVSECANVNGFELRLDEVYKNGARTSQFFVNGEPVETFDALAKLLGVGWP